MAVPPPFSVPTTAAMKNPASHPPPRGRGCGTLDIVLGGVVFFLVVLVLLFFSCFFLIGPEHPAMKVTDLSVFNLSAAEFTGATWEAVVLAMRPKREIFYESFLLSEVEVFIYYKWDTAQRLAVSSAEPFQLQDAAITLIKAEMRMERPEAEVAEDMDRERRSMGTVIVGLGVRMHITYLYGLWLKKSYGHVQACCDDLRIIFVNSTVKGSSGSTVEVGLVSRDDPVTGHNTPAINLPSCTWIY